MAQALKLGCFRLLCAASPSACARKVVRKEAWLRAALRNLQRHQLNTIYCTAFRAGGRIRTSFPCLARSMSLLLRYIGRKHGGRES